MKEEIIDLKRKLLKSENSVVASSIRIRGVPYYENENLFEIFDNICKFLKVPTPQVDNMYRLNKIYKDNKHYTPNDEVIVVKLCSPYDKNYLLRAIAKYRHDNKNVNGNLPVTLKLRIAGFDSDQPIYINENLTPYNYNIFRLALKMKKERKIQSTYTLRGLVYVKKLTSDEPMLIEFPEQINQLFHE